MAGNSVEENGGVPSAAEKGTLVRPSRHSKARMVEAALCILLVIAALGLTYHYVLEAGPGIVAGKYDVNRYFVPLFFYNDYAFSEGELPLWNPLILCGMPQCANPQALTFYPPQALRGLAINPPTPAKTQASFIVLLGLHMVLMGAGTYLLCRSLNISAAGAYTAVVALVFSAVMVRRACAFHFVTTIAWTPLLLLLLKQMLDGRRLSTKLGWASGASLVLGLTILGGLHLIPYLGVLVATFCVLYRLLAPCRVRSGAAGPAGQVWRRGFMDAICLALVPALALLLAAVQLVPLVEFAGFTPRGMGEDVGLYTNLWKVPLRTVIENHLIYAGTEYLHKTIRGSGAGALLLSLAALCSGRWRRTLLFLIPYLFLLDCTYGPPMPVARLVGRLSPFTLSTYLRAYDVALIPLSILAGIGVDAVSSRLRGRLRTVGRAAFLVLLGAAVLVPFVRCLLPLDTYLPVAKPWVIAFPIAAFVVMLAVGVLPGRRVVALALPLLILGEVLIWNQYYVPRLVGKPPAGASRLRQPQAFPAGNNTRGCDPFPMQQLRQLEMNMTGYEPLYIARVRQVLTSPSREGRYGRLVRPGESAETNLRGHLFLKRLFWLSSRWVDGPLPAKTRLWPVANTVFLQDAGELRVRRVEEGVLPETAMTGKPVMRELRTSEAFRKPISAGRVESKSLVADLPRSLKGRPEGPAGAVHSVLRVKYTSTCHAVIETAATRRERFGERESTRTFSIPPSGGGLKMIELSLPDTPSMGVTFRVRTSGTRGCFQFKEVVLMSDRTDEDGLIQDLQIGINSVELMVTDLPDFRILSFIDAHYPGWHAYVDDAPVPIYLANDAFKAIEVPPGTHRVRFEFVPECLTLGAGLSGLGVCIATLGIALAALACRKGAHRAPDTNAPA